jgi:hypothetical protein
MILYYKESDRQVFNTRYMMVIPNRAKAQGVNTMPIIRFRTTYNSPNSRISFKCCRDAASTEDAERQIMELFPDAINLQTFPENGADSRDADGNRIDWSEEAQGVNTMRLFNFEHLYPSEDKKEANENRPNPKGYELCAVCGRPVNPKTAITIETTSGFEAVPQDHPESTSLAAAMNQENGCWFVGPTCGKKIPTLYHVK